MVELNFVQFTTLFFNASVIMLSIFKLLIDEKYIPNILQGIVYHGKSMSKQEFSIIDLKVPKRYFRHFYLYAAPIFTIILLMAIRTYFFYGITPRIIYTILDLGLGSSRKANVSPEATLLAMILMTIHVWKRFYESHYVTVYSQAKMSLLVYIIGLVHYSILVSTIVGESYGFVRGFHKSFQLNKFTSTYNIICSAIMLLATYEQFQSNVILANLRKNKREKMSSNSYKLPTGRLFDFISTPLQFTEIVIYLTLTAILWESSTIYYISMWVFINQMANGYFQHQWYKQNFKNYPNRKVIIPFLW